MADRDPVTLELPWPISVNAYLRHVELPLGKTRCPCCGRFAKTRVATLISSEGREHLRKVDRLLLERRLPLMAGPLGVDIKLYPPDRRLIDVDNRSKPLLDALKRRRRDEDQTRWLFADDDSQVIDLRSSFGPIVPGGKAVLTITPVAGHVVQQELPLGTTSA